MRKLCFVLTALLLAVPAFAGMTISCAQVGDTNEVEISYAMDGGDANLPRAFGLDISVSAGTIDDISYTDPCFWVYPGTIVITGGSVSDYGNPVAPDADPGAQGQLGTSAITVEMGSLYADDDPNHTLPPADSGVLLTIVVSTDCNVTVAGNAARGEVVLESTDAAVTNLPSECEVVLTTDCYTGPDYTQWVAVGKPTSWCNPRQCHGDADGVQHTEKGQASPFWVGLPDLQVLSMGWYKPDTDANFNTFIAADFSHTSHTEKGIAYPFRCGLPDLQIMAYYWYGPNGGKPAPPADCLTATPVSP